MARVINLAADNFSIDSISSLCVGGSSVLQPVKPKVHTNNADIQSPPHRQQFVGLAKTDLFVLLTSLNIRVFSGVAGRHWEHSSQHFEDSTFLRNAGNR